MRDMKEIRICLWYEFKLQRSPTIAHRNMVRVFGKDAPRYGTVEGWFAKFRNGDLDFDPSNDHVIDGELLRAVMKKEPHISPQRLARLFNVSTTAVINSIKRMEREEFAASAIYKPISDENADNKSPYIRDRRHAKTWKTRASRNKDMTEHITMMF
ncbi:hypothetical protein Q1695_016323 [Nippostrongylus brasiliensis]|nr:hypothetical protein Q1695_016323 [Nippostrongylus brasiliensis]